MAAVMVVCGLAWVGVGAWILSAAPPEDLRAVVGGMGLITMGVVQMVGGAVVSHINDLEKKLTGGK